ncbi:hypothetical protein [Micromonospora sagamiensis]|uniref:ESAT-6 protein secretion system EspG family protein n=1 Tax=Micromonospora sagamiensis TaxID=47875 RepID=A0A562W8Q1_9ACTN|nr:hypothetical protein [Micromonospora sagamiensis]TWJ26659.1 hypothetical protein JD81_00121 [Micromonospora sagamiensis]BCL14455.1 hypothetical protein GCM10017556_21940 [Micromonospora sagamiensis]
MKPPNIVRLTSDELTAIAHGLGATLFPGVRASCFDAVAPEQHPLLADGFLMSLVARGLLAPDADGVLWPADELAALVATVANHRVHLTVEQTMPATHPDTVLRWEVMAGGAGVVRHLVDDPIHHFEIDPADGDLAARAEATVAELVDRSAGVGTPGRRQRWGRRSRLADVVPAPGEGWRRVTLLARADGDERSRVEGLLGVLDGGPGQLWLVHDETGSDDDEAVVAVPASSAEVDAALRALVAVPVR